MGTNFVITIGRQYGSGGREIGMLLSRMLGISYYDKKLITEAARHSGLSKDFFERSDERVRSSLFRAFSEGFDFRSGFSPESMFKIQSDAIKEIVNKESCVIVGRCADYVLRDSEYCFNIFVYAPDNIRAHRTAKRKDIGIREAYELMKKTDKARASYYNFYTEKQWGQSESYHLSLDSSVLGLEKSTEIIAEFVRQALEKMNAK